MWGKFFGALIGFRLAGPVGAVVGALVGHFGYDEIRANKSQKGAGSPPPPPRPQGYYSRLEKAYETLGLKPGASLREVKSSYRRKCKELHPDVLQNKGLGESAMKALEAELRRVTEAYETILEFSDAKN